MSDNQEAERSIAATAEIATTNAKRYLTQLCKHFEHKIPVTYGDRDGEITFSLGTCALRADEGVLKLHVVATNQAALPQLEDVVARHLIRFAFREDIDVEWHSAVEPSIERS